MIERQSQQPPIPRPQGNVFVRSFCVVIVTAVGMQNRFRYPQTARSEDDGCRSSQVNLERSPNVLLRTSDVDQLSWVEEFPVAEDFAVHLSSGGDHFLTSDPIEQRL